MISFILLTFENATKEEIEAAENIFDNYYPRMVSKAYDILHNREDAEDAAMAAFQKIADKPWEFVEWRSEQTVFKIIYMTKNEAIDIYRKNKKRNEIFVDIEDIENYNEEDCEDAWEIAVRKEEQEQLQRAINELDERSKTVILMSYYGNMKNRDIAKEIGLDSNHVNVIVYRTKKVLKDKLLEMGYKR